MQRIRVIDAFTDEPFAGNPAAVCLLDGDGWPDAAWMQRVAAEMNLSETAFAHPLEPGGAADYALRWFTPAAEVELCGHATLATAHALAADRGGAAASVRFSTHSGVLIAHSHADGTITLDFPAAPTTAIAVPAGLADALGGAAPRAAFATGALGDLLALFDDEAAVRALAPDVAALRALTRRLDLRGVITTARATDADIVSRFFAPAVGIPEDPVTGSAHTALAPFWSARLGRSTLTAVQASPRGGRLQVAVEGDRVHLTGRAVTVLDGQLRVS